MLPVHSSVQREVWAKVKPKVLVAATSHWFTTARLAVALADAGCVVEAVCPPRHPLRKASAVSRIHAYQGLRPLLSMTQAIAAAQPDFIVPGDDRTTWHLYQLFVQARRSKGDRAPICELIERSIGAPESFPLVHARASFMKMAQAEGVRVPETEVIGSTAELKKWIARTGFPTVLKADGSSGGEGVRIVRTFQEAEHAFKVLQAPPLVARAAKRALIDHDKTLIWPTLLRQRAIVNAQAFVPGGEATSTIACWKGAVLAELHFEVLNKRDAAGPATVVRLIDKPEMSIAAAKVARRLNLSGLHGLDFMIEASTGNAYLIEMNPRATQVGHLKLGIGRDLPGALYAAVSGEPVQLSPKVTDNETIALFPQEWIRDPASTFLRSGYHDVPWGELELVRACVRRRRQTASNTQQNWAQGLFRRLAAFPFGWSTESGHRARLDCEAE